MSKFEDVLNINVNEKTEKKNGLTYLSWAWAWAEFKKIYPDATYEVKRFGDFPYIHDETGYMVFTSVTAEALTYEMWLPVLDNRGKAIVKPTVFEINKTIMRCLTKNLAMFGLGLYIYAGEDLPEAEAQKPAAETQKPATAPQKGKAEGKYTEPREPASNPQEPQDELTAAMMTKVTIRGTAYTLAGAETYEGAVTGGRVVEADVRYGTYTLTVDNFENVSGYGNYTGSVNVNGTDVGLAANQIMRGTGANDGAIQMRNKDNNPSYVYNTVALPAAIVSIEVTFSSEMTRDGQFGISVGTSELANAPESISWTGTTYTYTPSVSDATYFTIGHTESGTNAIYIASIVITIAA